MHIEHFACDKCQQANSSGPGHGLLPNQDIAGAPREEVAVDLLGPWPASTPYGTVEFFTLTCIDTTTNLLEIAQIFNNLVTMLLPVLSTPGSLSTLNLCKSSMIMGESSQDFPSNSCYTC